jgi:hypothetical protein
VLDLLFAAARGASLVAVSTLAAAAATWLGLIAPLGALIGLLVEPAAVLVQPGLGRRVASRAVAGT